MMILLSLAIALMVHQTNGEIQDMTWVMDPDKMSYFPIYRNNPEFHYKYELKHAGPNPSQNIDYVAFGLYSTGEHVGTHIDAPFHFFANGKHIDEIPLEDLTGPLVMINISQKASQSPDVQVEVQDLMDWENKYGKIPDRAFVLMKSGWDAYFGDDEKYLGLTATSNGMHFPGFGGDASKWLLENRNILGVGVDVVSCDPGQGTKATHRTLLPAGKVCIENLRNSGKVPECGARFTMMPIMLKGGTASQGRASAEWYTGVGYMTNCKGKVQKYGPFSQPPAHSRRKRRVLTKSTASTPAYSAVIVVSVAIMVNFLMK